jgi:penicillin-binding protein-related factor A (putative recombinase)
MRSNVKNTGLSFQKEIETTGKGYQKSEEGILFHKVDFPLRIVGTKENRKFIPQRNPFLDYSGVVWIGDRGYRLDFEAKSTKTNRLPIGRSGGITATQVEAIREWGNAGSVVFVLWKVMPEDKVGLVWGKELVAMVEDGLVSIKFSDPNVCPIERGKGFVLWDFLKEIRDTKNCFSQPA